MKNARAIVMIVLSLVAGVVAVILAASWVGQKAAENTTPVVVSMRDLDLGAPLLPAALQTVPWPTAAMPDGVFQDAKKLEGRVVKTPMYKGEPILEQKLAAPGSKGGLPSLIQNGKRAISVHVNEVVGVAGFTLPGSYVDIMVNTMEAKDARDSKEVSVSKIVLKRILVLAIAQEANRDETKPKVVSAVTLEVTPEEAEKIDLARSIGSLSLVLRNPLDEADATTTGMRRDELLNKEVVPAPMAVVAASAPAQAASAPPPPPRVAKPRRPAAAATAKAPAAMPPSDAKVEVIRGVQKANSEL